MCRGLLRIGLQSGTEVTIGGGAFGNRAACIDRALARFARSGLDVVMVGYGG